MKKFITGISLQITNLQLTRYYPAENKHLDFDVLTRFPITITIRAAVERGDHIEIIAIISGNKKSTEANYNTFKQEIEDLSKEMGFTYEIKELREDINDKADDMIRLFFDIIGIVNDGDKLYTCITYGTKPMPVFAIMALHYAYRMKKDISIEKIVYGFKDWTGEDPAYIHDVTPLFYIDSAIDSLAKMKLDDPEDFLKRIIDVDGKH